MQSKAKSTRGTFTTGITIFLIILFALGLGLRLIKLGHWAYHHDESIHAFYAYRLYDQGRFDDHQRNIYEYSPVYHGPFLYHIGALFFFLFGDNDFTGRLPFAAFGILMMFLVYQLHHLIGKPRAVLALLFVVISPGLTYFSRFARNDVYFATETLAIILFTLLYFRDRRTLWFCLLAVSFALLYATKENSYVAGFVLCSFLAGYVLVQTFQLRWFFLLAYSAVALLFLEKKLYIRELVLWGPLAAVFFLRLAWDYTFAKDWKRDFRNASQRARNWWFIGYAIAVIVLWLIYTTLTKKLDPGIFARSFRGVSLSDVVALLFSFLVLSAVLWLLFGRLLCVNWKRVWRQAFTDYFELTTLIGLYGIFSICTFLYIKIPIDALRESILRTAGGGDITREIAQRQFDGYIEQHAGFPTAIVVLGIIGVVLFLAAIHFIRALFEKSNDRAPEVSPPTDTGISSGLPVRWLLSDLRLVGALAIIAVVYVFLFTTMFSNADGLTDGITDYVRYWYAQKFKPRIAQGELGPFYYVYFFFIYDLGAFLLAMWGVVYFGIRLALRVVSSLVAGRTEQPGQEKAEPSRATPLFLSLWTLAALVVYGSLHRSIPWPSILPYILLILPVAVVGEYYLYRSVDSRLDRVFLGFWTLAVLALYVMLHIWVPWRYALRYILPTLPVAIIGGHILFGFVDRRLSRPTPEEGEPSLTIPVFLSYWTLAALGIYAVLHERVPWLYTHQALPVAILAGYFLGEMYLRLRGKRRVWVPVAVLVAIVSAFSLRANILLNLQRGDDAREVMVYVQSSHTVREIVREVERIAYEAGTFENTTIGVSGWAQWPFSWYFRHYESKPGGRDRQYLVNIAEPKDHPQLKVVFGDQFEYSKYRFRDHWSPRYEKEFIGEKFSRKWWKSHLKYFFYRTPWSPVGGAELMFYKKRQLREVAPMVECPPGSERPPRPGGLIKSWGRHGGGNEELNSPRGLAVSPTGHLYVCDTQNFRIQKFTLEGEFVLSFGGRTTQLEPGKFAGATGVACDSQGTVYVADTWGHRIQKFDPSGQFITQWTSGTGTKFFGPRDLAIDTENRVYVADTGNKRVLVYDSEGKFLNQQIGRDGSAPGEFVEPVGIDISPQNEIFVADVGNKRIQILTTLGRFLKQWNVCGWESAVISAVEPYVAVADDGTIYATDSTRNCVYQFAPEGGSVIVWGTLGSGSGQLRQPTGIAVDQNGFVYVADTANHRINKYRKLQ